LRLSGCWVFSDWQDSQTLRLGELALTLIKREEHVRFQYKGGGDVQYVEGSRTEFRAVSA